MKPRHRLILFCSLVSFLLGATFGLVLTNLGISVWWIFFLDIIVGCIILVIIVRVYRQDKLYRLGIKKEEDNSKNGYY
jgi:O-antigen/teichoic acid export membrane protein